MNVIILDDEQLSRNRLEKSVRAADPDVNLHIFESAEEAYLYVEENPCDVAVLDIQGMDVDGITIARRMTAIKPRLNIIFSTGYTQYALDAFGLNASAYLLKPVTADAMKHAFMTLRYPPESAHRLYVRCFGNFDLFYDGKPVRFRRAKTKELFAFLFDRRGSSCTSREICCALWEEDGHDSYFKQIKKDLIDTFTELGLAHLLVRDTRTLAIVYDKMESDLKAYLTGVADPMEEYRGEYMVQYSWAEDTNAWIQRIENSF